MEECSFILVLFPNTSSIIECLRSKHINSLLICTTIMAAKKKAKKAAKKTAKKAAKKKKA